ncbi:hypothetical protein Hanom_Chr06g00528631 [Helianthus anomalus]
MASETLRLSFCSFFCITDPSFPAPATEAEGDEEDDDVSNAAAVEDSDLSAVRMRPCSTVSSSVLVRLDQHSSAAAIVVVEWMVDFGLTRTGIGMKKAMYMYVYN